MKWYLRSSEPPLVTCIEKTPTILGSGETCDIRIQADGIITAHLRFEVDSKRLTITNLAAHEDAQINGKSFKKAKLNGSNSPINRVNAGSVNFELIYAAPEAIAVENDSAPAAPDEPPEWFFESQGRTFGPLTISQVFAAADLGKIKPTDDFWQIGMKGKVKAYEVAGLFDNYDDTKTSGVGDIKDSVICPYCWTASDLEDLVFIANHPDLIGDSVLGTDEFQRFLPSRMTPAGLSLDSMGVVCPDLACPSCHLRIPRGMLEQTPIFMSVVGAPGSGKSFYLASSTWQLRSTLQKHFGVGFMDADASTNQWLNDYEQKLFLQTDQSGYQNIVKTDMQAPAVYRQVLIRGMPVFLPLPGLFNLQFPSSAARSKNLADRRSLVLYDNAGEHFQAGADSASTPGTKHMAHAEGILFLFDPTEDARFRPLLEAKGSDLSVHKLNRQDILLVEMIGRVRKHLAMAQGQDFPRTVMFGVSKADLLPGLRELIAQPWFFRNAPEAPACINLPVIDQASKAVRALLLQTAPEMVSTIESFSSKVLYLPLSALGHNPSPQGVRPHDIQPAWVELPLLYTLHKMGYVEAGIPAASPGGKA